MTGVEPRTSGIESDRSTNWATTTSPYLIVYNNENLPKRNFFLSKLEIFAKYKRNPPNFKLLKKMQPFF